MVLAVTRISCAYHFGISSRDAFFMLLRPVESFHLHYTLISLLSMSSRPALVPTNRANQLVGAVIAGKSHKEAAELFEIPTRTADYIVKKYCETGSVNRRTGQGRKPIITPRMERLVIATAKKYRRMPFYEVGKHVRPQISASSVHRILDKVGLHRRKG